MPQPGVIHVPQSTFLTLKTSMTGVNVTTNVPSSVASVENCVTSTSTRVSSNVTDRERVSCTPTGVRNNVAEVKDRDSNTSTPTMVGNSAINTEDNSNTENATTVTSTPTGVGNDVNDSITMTDTETGNNVVSANSVIESSVTSTPTEAGTKKITSVDNTVSNEKNSENDTLHLEQEVTSSSDKCTDSKEATSEHQLENDVTTSQDKSGDLVGVTYDLDGPVPSLLEALVPGNHSNTYVLIHYNCFIRS